MRLELGNTSPKEGHRNDDDSVTFTAMEGNRVTVVNFPEGTSIGEAFASVTAPNGIWSYHSEDAPAWVECESEGLQALLVEHFGCEAGKPADVEDNYHTDYGPPGVGPEEEDEV